MNCEQAGTMLIAYIKGELPGTGTRKTRLEEHLAMCPACRQQLEEARRVLSWTDAASEGGVIRTVHEIIENAIKGGASDIHVEPERDNTMRVRVRIDGVLHEAFRVDASHRDAVITRLKMMADMDVQERRIPQDGRIPVKSGDKEFDIRASCVPYVYGEAFTMRILDRSTPLIGLDRLGFSENDLSDVLHLLRQPCGLLLVAGPTGAGKTTTLYSMLSTINSPDKKMVTIEDPVEYLLSGVNQAHVHKAAGFTFHSALRSFMRQDPDVIMVGEIRDMEMAQLSIQAAITGHLVLTNVHTQDSLGAITRLLDIGIEPYLVSASLLGVVAQRLMRKVCDLCAEPYEIDPRDPAIKALRATDEELAQSNIRAGKGCDACHHIGYKGRTGLFEVLTVNRDLAAMIAEGASQAEMREAALAAGFRPMVEDARRKVLAGITSPAEALRLLAHVEA